MSHELPVFLRRDWLDVGDGHELHLVQYGNPDGIPLLYLHGGPGGGCVAEDLKLFDKHSYRILMLDQRGSGRSTPKGDLRHNNLQALLDDIEAVRVQLNIDSWCVVGGSYGATLGFIYSGLFPHRVMSQVLWGLFVPSDEAVTWLYGANGAANLFPQEYLAFTSLQDFTPCLDTFFVGYRKGLDDPDIDTHNAYVYHWLSWELALSLPSTKLPDIGLHFGKSLAQIELHFASHQYFNSYQLMCVNANKITAKTVILQGEMDWVCPVMIGEKFLSQYATEQIHYSVIKGGYHGLANDRMFEEVVFAVREMACNIKHVR
ncbi:alpha/beta fold hydrolase [Shewanella sp. D64]|uniref:alpha/beta fold hydrolase n=1 Tax=unclassified Shewanella TaxID=196818 RepID=UPI0022BA1FBA|nr:MULTISPECIES: alpha/beta fold hydrolase [unclassified Shewanella]MEC4726870.1 alpha/beta fold hydrolase [Shewanella sp. D64]MEC4739018.1 alpha/beta fold hydrolase [Shewanella sp. E94]WBJ95879.1 alpha/beta fold hydrolase [Shewanella sp. MTB7]